MLLMWLNAGTDRWDAAEAIYNRWPARIQELPINLEEISIMYTSQGKCELMLETLQKAHGDEVKIYGEISPNASRSNSNLALNRVHCLRLLDRDAEADEILARVRTYVGTLRQNTVYGFYTIDAKLHVLDGDVEGALDILEAAAGRDEVGWTDRYDPILRTLAGEPRFQALFRRIDDAIDAMRAELGMPPASR